MCIKYVSTFTLTTAQGSKNGPQLFSISYNKNFNFTIHSSVYCVHVLAFWTQSKWSEKASAKKHHQTPHSFNPIPMERAKTEGIAFWLTYKEGRSRSLSLKWPRWWRPRSRLSNCPKAGNRRKCEKRRQRCIYSRMRRGRFSPSSMLSSKLNRQILIALIISISVIKTFDNLLMEK